MPGVGRGIFEKVARRARAAGVSVPLVHTWVALAGLTLAGCEEDCDIGETRCHDGAAEICERETSDGHTLGKFWKSTPCGAGACIDLDDQEPFCAEDEAPDPRCEPSQEWRSRCDGPHLLRCQHGYLTDMKDCAPNPGHCVELEGGGAQCSIASTPDPPRANVT